MARRVLLIVENLPVPFDRRVSLEATTLADAGYDVSVICPAMKGFPAGHEYLDGIYIWRHPLIIEATGGLDYVIEYSSALFWQFTLSFRVLFGKGFDAIHACNPPDLIFIVAALFKVFGKRFLFDHHDLCPELYDAKNGRNSGVRWVLKLLERCTFRLADVVISTNDSYRHIALTRGRRTPDRVFVVRSGPDLARWPRSVEPNPSWRNGRTYLVGYAGVMGEQEGLDLLIQSIRYIVHDIKRTDIQFVLIGSGNQKEKLSLMAKELDVDAYITFTDRVPDQVLIEILGSSDLCVNPDRPSDLNDKSTMNKIIEYMALGRPIVQFEATEGRFSAQEASLYARPGDIKDFGDKIIDLLNDPVGRRSMGSFGRQRVEDTLAWEHSSKILLQAYEKLFEGYGKH